MEKLIVNVKRIGRFADKAVIPSYKTIGSAGMDLTATSKWFDEKGNVCYGTSLAYEIPLGFVGFLLPRSSISDYTVSLANSVGTIDSDYRGEIIAKFKPTNVFTEDGEGATISDDFDDIEISDKEWSYEDYKVGDRICQMIILPKPLILVNEVEDLSDTERNAGGFGSTGK